MNWAARALDPISRGKPVAMVTIVQVAGSAPRDAGARMIVSEDAAFDTIGGGNLELQLIDQARRLLTQNFVRALQQDYPLGPLLAQCCGGRVRVLIERVDAASRPWLAIVDKAEDEGRPYTLEGIVAGGEIARTVTPGWPVGATEAVNIFARSGVQAGQKENWTRVVERIAPAATPLYLFGAGHVGCAIAHIARTLPFRLHWHDERPENALHVGASFDEDLPSVVAKAPAGAFFLVVTHAHELDYSLVRAVLKRGNAAFCGLIGSTTKRMRFVSRLAKEGVPSDGLTCPIGAGVIRSKAPAAIAVGVAAELLAVLEAGPAAGSHGWTAPNPPPPGVSTTNTSPAATSTLAVAPNSSVSPLLRRR